MDKLEKAIVVRDAKANVLHRYQWSIPAENDFLMAQTNVELLASQQSQEVEIPVKEVNLTQKKHYVPREVSHNNMRGGFKRNH